jgi:methionyl-tRNA formyltransferase
MRVVVVGCVDFSEAVLQKLLSISGVKVCGVLCKSKSNFNSDFRDLAPTAQKSNVPVLAADHSSAEDICAWTAEKSPDLVFVCGWSQLLPSQFLKIPRLGVIGYHPAALPKNRGRHPLIWALALGLTETASTFFWMDEGADSGPILHQMPVQISESDNASSLYEKVTRVALEQIKEFVSVLLKGEKPSFPQNHEAATYWRKRSAKDGQIDWRMTAASIHNLIRALSKPYPGATFSWKEQSHVVWCSQAATDFPEEKNMEPGKILETDGNKLRVKCGDGSLWIEEHDLKALPQAGDYL